MFAQYINTQTPLFTFTFEVEDLDTQLSVWDPPPSFIRTFFLSYYLKQNLFISLTPKSDSDTEFHARMSLIFKKIEKIIQQDGMSAEKINLYINRYVNNQLAESKLLGSYHKGVYTHLWKE
jgi:hypothetical protein